MLLGVATKEFASFTRLDTGDRRVVDLLFRGQTAEDLALLAVNDAGSIFRHSLLDAQGRV